MLWEVGGVLQPHRCLCCLKSRAGIDAVARVLQAKDSQEGSSSGSASFSTPKPVICSLTQMAVICSFPLVSLRTFWFIPLLHFQCTISCEWRWVLSKMKDNRLLMHPSSHWHDTLPLPADLCGYLSACCFSLPVIYTSQLSIHTTRFTAKLICIRFSRQIFRDICSSGEARALWLHMNPAGHGMWSCDETGAGGLLSLL